MMNSFTLFVLGFLAGEISLLLLMAFDVRKNKIIVVKKEIYKNLNKENLELINKISAR